MALFCLAAVAPLTAEDPGQHGPYQVGMPFEEFVGVLQKQLARNRMEVDPPGVLFRSHAPLAPFRIWTFAPFYVDPRLTEQFVFNDGRLIGIVMRERMQESPFVTAESPPKKSKQTADEDREPVVLSETGRKLRDRWIDRYGRPQESRGSRGIVYSWRRNGYLLSYALVRSEKRVFLEKTVVRETETKTLYSNAGDYRTNLEVDALNNRVFRSAPEERDPTWESGLYPYRVGPCDAYRGPLDLFGCTLRLDFGEKESGK